MASAIELNQKDGLFDQVLETAKKVDFSNNRVAIQARKWYQEKIQADPDIQDLLTAIHETYGPMSVVLAGVGGSARGATDTTRHWAEEELPAYTSYESFARAIRRSRLISETARQAGGKMLNLMRDGMTMDQVYETLVTEPRAAADAEAAGGGAGAGAAGPTTSTQRPPPAGPRMAAPAAKHGEPGTYGNPYDPPANPAEYKPGSFYNMPYSPGRPVQLGPDFKFHHVDPKTLAVIPE
jgi:hypothetical protein